jgi:serine phosphatase RsbU (regulator of sigma subunit)
VAILIETSVQPETDAQQRIRELEFQLERTAAEYGDLADMGAILASLIDLEEVLAALMEMALRMVGGQVGAIVLQTPKGLEPRVSWGLDHRVLPKITWNDQPLVERTISSSEGALLAPYDGLPVVVDGLTLQLESVISQPIITQNETAGCVVIVNKLTGGVFTKRDQLILSSLVNFASVAVKNSRLLAESLERQRLEHELSLAEHVQKTLVPKSNLTVGGTGIESLYIPARKVGGDYFDVLPQTDGSFFLAVGDVSSKGVPAALLMSAVRSVVRASTQRTGSVAQIVNEINRVVCADLTDQKEMFITFFLALVRPLDGTIFYTNAGHLPPLLWRMADGDISELAQGGVFLGQFPEFEYTESAATFARGDRLLAYTDGIVEAADSDGKLYGRARLNDFLKVNAHLRPGAFLRKLREDLEKGYTHADYIDDVTAVFMEFNEAGI